MTRRPHKARRWRVNPFSQPPSAGALSRISMIRRVREKILGPAVRALIMLSIISAGAAVAQDYAIDWHTIDGGGEMSGTGGSFKLAGTIGQADASSFAMPMTGGSFELVGGFWPVAGLAGPPLPGDCDVDGDVDPVDYAGFHTCLSGPGDGADPGCECFDFNGDGHVDLFDFAGLQAAFTG